MTYYVGPISVHGFPLLLRMSATGAMEKYNFISRKWLATNDYSGIFIGEPQVDTATEEEVNDIIEQY